MIQAAIRSKRIGGLMSAVNELGSLALRLSETVRGRFWRRKFNCANVLAQIAVRKPMIGAGREDRIQGH
jgi:hypothetical protein